jgi:hypothetical protein
MGYEFKVGSYDWKVLEEIQIELPNENILNHQYEAKPDNVKLSNMLNAIVVIDSPKEIHSQKTEQALKYLILKKGYKTKDILLQMNFVTTDEVEKELLKVEKDLIHTINDRIAVGDTFDGEKTSAKILNGVLYLTIPKKEEAKPKKVTIKVG